MKTKSKDDKTIFDKLDHLDKHNQKLRNDNMKFVKDLNERNSRIKILENYVLKQAETYMIRERKLKVQNPCDQRMITNVQISEHKKHNEY